ncbi:MAG: hypothetical protein FWD99_09575 [Oscillospiraceae bacterium]|nr:hypothetical protein [Oscillospiraceae bacterium]
MKENFGNLLFERTLTQAKAMQRMFLFLIVALVFIAAGIVAFVMAESDTDVLYAWTVLLGLCSIPFILRVFTSTRASSVVVYEKGFVHTRSSKTTKFDFNDIIGIRDLTKKETWFAFILPVVALKSRVVTIEMKNGTTVKLNQTGVPDFRQFADELSVVFTEHLLSGVTKETLSQISISFGKELELRNGQLFYNDGKSETVIPFDAILDIEVSDTGHHIMLIGEEKEKKNFVRTDILAQVASETSLNIGALYHIVQIAKEVTSSAPTKPTQNP